MAKLTADDKERLAALSDDELRVEIEVALRRQMKTDADRKAYAKSCADLIARQKAIVKFAIDTLEDRQRELTGDDGIDADEGESLLDPAPWRSVAHA